MKDKKNKSIKSLSEEIIKLETDIQQGKNIQNSEQKIENIISSLTIEEILQIDDYIIANKLL